MASLFRLLNKNLLNIIIHNLLMTKLIQDPISSHTIKITGKVCICRNRLALFPKRGKDLLNHILRFIHVPNNVKSMLKQDFTELLEGDFKSHNIPLSYEICQILFPNVLFLHRNLVNNLNRSGKPILPKLRKSTNENKTFISPFER